jgi:small subunit ribosomal protein S1
MAKAFKIKRHFQDFKEFLKPPKEGDIVEGTILDKGGGNLYLDLKSYKTGIVKKDDLKYGGEDVSKLEKGEELTVKIVGPETKAGFIPVSLSEARKDIVWEDLEKKRDKKETLNLKVASANKGGLLFNISGIQGFLPVSQLSKKNYPKMEDPTPDKIFQKLQEFVGKEMKVEVITVDKYKNKLIVKEAE